MHINNENDVQSPYYEAEATLDLTNLLLLNSSCEVTLA